MKYWCFNCWGVCIALLPLEKIEAWNEKHTKWNEKIHSWKEQEN